MSKSKVGNNVSIPMPVTLIGTVLQEKVNFMTAGWVTRVGSKPPKIGIGINKANASAEGIKTNKSFSVCFPNGSLLEKTDYCGIVSGKKIDKSNVFKVFYGDLQSAPMIEECPLCLECALVETLEGETNYFFIGEIKGAYAEDSCVQDGKIDPGKTGWLILTMPDNAYRSLGQKIGDAWSIGKNFKP